MTSGSALTTTSIPRLLLDSSCGAWTAALLDAGRRRGWRTRQCHGVGELDCGPQQRQPHVAVIGWRSDWQEAEWSLCTRLCHTCPTMVVGDPEVAAYETVLRQLGARGVFSSTLQRPQLFRLIERLVANSSDPLRSLEASIQLDLAWLF